MKAMLFVGIDLHKCSFTTYGTDRDSGTLHKWFAAQYGKLAAIVAMARKLLVWALALEKSRTVFDPRRLAA